MTPCGLILFAWWAALQGDAAVAPINDGLAFDTPATQQADGVFLPPETSMRWTGWGTAAPDEFEIEIHLDPVAYESVGLVVADSSCEAEPLSIHPRETGSVIPPRRIGLEVRGEYWMYREDGRPVRRMRPGGSDLDCLVLSSTTSALRVRSLKVGPIDGEPTQFVKLSTRRPPAPRLALFVGLLVALGLVLTALEERVAAASRFSIEPSARRWQHLHALPMIAAAGAYLGTGHGSVAVPIAFAWWVVARLVFVFRYGPWDRGSLANARTHAVAFALAGAAVLIVSKNVPADPAIRGVSLPFLFGAAILWGALSTPWGKEPARGYLRLLATCVDIGAIALAPAAWAEGNARSILVLFGLAAPAVAFMAALSSRAKTHRLY
ncbi:hypothetical protein KDL45_15260, partial [bacterium]|nr:hypothetical protein [bacterium]